jgi:hypothetical protein
MQVEIAAFVAAGIWGVYTFVYQTHIAPLFETAHETITGDVTRIGTTPAAYIERVTVTIRNNGQVPVDTAGMAFNLYGLRDVHQAPAAIKRPNGVVIAEQSTTPDSWTLLGSYADLRASVQTGDPGSHVILNPDDSARIEFLAVAPRGRYTALKLSTDTIYVRYPFTTKIPVTLVRDAGGAFHLNSSVSLKQAFPVSSNWYFPV